MTKAEKHDTAPPPPSETWLRVMAPSFEMDDTWKTRPPMSKAMFAISGAAARIAGLAEICWTMNLAEMKLGGQWAGERGARHPYGFIATTLDDIARALREADKLHKIEGDREDAEARRAERRVKT